jgi:putative transposase
VKSFKYKLLVSKAVQNKFEQTLSLCAELYNSALQERRDAWKLNRVSINFHSQAIQLPLIKVDRPELENIYSQVLQDTLRRLSKAFDSFFRRVKQGDAKVGFPRFKSTSRYDSFCYVQSGFKIVEDKLHLSKIGSARVKLHRPIEGVIKTCTIKRESNGWYVVFATDTENLTQMPISEIQNAVALDMGLTTFATLSNEEKIKNPKFFKTDEKALAKANRALSKETKHNKSFKRRVKVLQKIHRRIANRRNNFAHQESRRLVNRFDLIVFEDLSITKMMKNGFLAQGIADAAWNQLISFSKYKAENAGKWCETVNPAYTSQTCRICGHCEKANRETQAKFVCKKCHHTENADLNAAKNILSLGLQRLGNQSLEATSKLCLVVE